MVFVPSRSARRAAGGGEWRINPLSLSHQPEQRTCHFSGGVCSIPTLSSFSLSLFSCSARSFRDRRGRIHTPRFLTGSPSANLSFSRGCVQRDSLSLSFWRLTN